MPHLEEHGVQLRIETGALRDHVEHRVEGVRRVGLAGVARDLPIILEDAICPVDTEVEA